MIRGLHVAMAVDAHPRHVSFLVVMYVPLAHTEQAEAREMLDDEFDRYAVRASGWFLRLGRPRTDRGLV